MRVLRIVAVVLLWFPASAVIRQLEPSPSDASEFSESYGLYPVSTTQQLNAATVRIDSRGGGSFDVGTGVGVAAHVVVTAAHLTKDRVTIVTRCDDSAFAADRVERGTGGLDLAMVVTAGPDLVPMQLADADPAPGDEVTIVGYPTGVRTVIDARIEGALTRRDGKVLRFSPEPRGGESGAPLVDRDGKLVGIAFADDTVGGQGLAFPVSRVRTFLEQGGAAGVPVAPAAEGDVAAASAHTPACG